MNVRLGSLLIGSVVSIVLAPNVDAQDTAFVRALKTHASQFTIVDGRLRGAGAEVLSRAAKENQFLLVGEDHGIREVPAFVGALFDAARPAGYSHIAVEIGPVSGRRLESMLRAPTAQNDLAAFFDRYTGFTLPFFFWREEAQMLERVVKSVPLGRGVVWGLDQEFIMSPTYLFERLVQLAPSPAARTFVSEYARASAAGDKAMIAQKNPGAVWMVKATDDDVNKLTAAFAPSKNAEAAEILRELTVSRDIYRMFNAGTNYESNQKRDDLMKRHFVDAYRAAQARGERLPKAVIKLGANHVFRGPSITGSYEMGSFLPEFAIANGTTSFGILLVVAKGTSNAYRPFGSTEADKTAPYDLLTSSEYAVFDMKSVVAASSGSDWTLIDLRPVRAMSLNGSLKGLDPTAKRLLGSFDAVVVVPEGHASVFFR